MRGMMFVAFIDWGEQQFGEAVIDEVLTSTPTATGGAYTNVGQYEYQELLALLGALGARVQQPVGLLCQAFGQFLLPVLVDKHREFVDLSAGLRGFLEGLDSHIHKEVLRLYPNSLPPRVRVQSNAHLETNRIELHYESHRPMSDLALGLLLGAVSHFKAKAEVTREDNQLNPGFAHFRVILEP
jgi:hypothetical protein